MTTLYRIAKLLCLGIIAYSLWKISQKDFVAKVTSDSPEWLDELDKSTEETRNQWQTMKASKRIGVDL